MDPMVNAGSTGEMTQTFVNESDRPSHPNGVPFLQAAFELAGEIAAEDGTYQEVAAFAMERIVALFGGEGACLEITDGTHMVYEAAVGIAAPFLGLRLPIGESLSGLVMRMGEPTVSDDSETDERVNREACRRIGLRSMLLLPLRYGKRDLGVLKVTAARPNAYRLEADDALGTLSKVLGATIGRVRGEEALRESEERYRATFNNLAVGIAEVGLDGRFLDVNEAMCDIVGRSYKQLVQMSFNDITYPEDIADDGPMIGRLLRGEFDHYAREKRYLKGDGSLLWVSVTFSTIQDANGKPIKLVKVVQDINVRKEAEEARHVAEAASKARARYLANMSHEIRTPMTGVIGVASLLQEKELDEDSRALVGTILSSGETLLRIIDDILGLSKMEAGRLDIEAVPTQIDQVVARVVALYEANARRKGLAISVRPPEEPMPRVLADPLRIQQVLANLVSNALKFTEEGGVEIAWTGKESDGLVALRLEVRDSGTGIPADRLDGVFESFTQADTSTQRRYGGTGLGLTISRQLTELMGGTLTAESKVGSGSVFTVALSFELAGEEAVGDSAPRNGDLERPLKVLVAEDNAVNVLVARRMLERLGCTVDIASDGLQAVDMSADGGYDLIFMDLHMPLCDGPTATRIIRHREEASKAPRLPILALTASAMGEDREECLRAGMDGFVSKPMTMDALRGALQTHMKP
ncbi:hypothetical protein BH11ARM2_BH11ARM2_24920 [soil metagenome]